MNKISISLLIVNTAFILLSSRMKLTSLYLLKIVDFEQKMKSKTIHRVIGLEMSLSGRGLAWVHQALDSIPSPEIVVLMIDRSVCTSIHVLASG